MKYLLDTHVWIWWFHEPQMLSTQLLDLLKSPKNYSELLLSAISPWEFCKLVEKDKIEIYMDPMTWISSALSMRTMRLVPISPTVSFKATTLPGAFHADPADQIIVATARDENAVVLTKDPLIRDYPHVKSIW